MSTDWDAALEQAERAVSGDGDDKLADRLLAFELDPRNFTEAMRLRNKLALRPRLRRRLTRALV